MFFDRAIAVCTCTLALSAAQAGAQGGIAGTVYDSLSAHGRLANATVVLVELGRYATSDARGRFRFDSVPDGRYTLGFTHAMLDTLDLELAVVPVTVAGGHRATVKLATPSAATVYARLCPGPREKKTSIIVGRVHDAGGHAVLADAVVSTDWTEFTLGAGRPAAHRVRAAARSNSKGVYVLCGVPTGIPVELEAKRGAFDARPVQFSLDERPLRRVDFALSFKDSAVIAGSSAVGVSTAGQRGTPLGIGREARGLAPDTVKALAPSIPTMDDGFETRRMHGLGSYITADEIARHNYPDLASVIQGMRGLHIAYGSSGMPIAFMIGVTDFTAPLCVPNVFLDGVPFTVAGGDDIRGIKPDQARFGDLSALARPERIRGIEVYSNPGTTPAEYDRSSLTGCGSIVIWTK